jgi:hypothetical protein
MRKRASYKGIYKPTNPKKYVGNINHIVYRSLWERKFMVYCDTQENIKHWSSEEFHVVYYNPVTKKLHKYFPDFVIKTNKNENFMIEVKPAKYTVPPKKPKRKTKAYMAEQLEYIKNKAKWSAAEEYCEQNNLKFKIFTEKELAIPKPKLGRKHS